MNAIAPIDTDLARVDRSAPDLLEVHFAGRHHQQRRVIHRILQMRQKLTLPNNPPA